MNEQGKKQEPESRPKGTGAKTQAAIRVTDSWPRLRGEGPVAIPSFDAVAWQSLGARAEVVLLEAKQKYSDRPAEMCKHVIREMTPHVAAEVSAKRLTKNSAIWQMYTWAKEILKANTLVPLRWLAETPNPIVQKARDEFLFEEQIRPSAEWQVYVRAIADAGKESPDAPSLGSNQDEHDGTKRISPRSGIENPEVAKRRAIVRNNRALPAERLCQMLDDASVPLPCREVRGNNGTWAGMYRHDARIRRRIMVILSKDKKEP